MRKSNFALRLQPSLLDEARKVAETEGVALNQLINVAVAEKLRAQDGKLFRRTCGAGKHPAGAHYSRARRRRQASGERRRIAQEAKVTEEARIARI